MPRTIVFEGRRITVPDDATDDDVAQILGGQPATPAASATPAYTGRDETGMIRPLQPDELDTTTGLKTYDENAFKGVAQATGRGLVQGALAIPDLVRNGMNFGVEMGTRGVERMTGKTLPRLTSIPEEMGSKGIVDAATATSEAVGYEPVDTTNISPSAQAIANMAEFAAGGFAGGATLAGMAGRGQQFETALGGQNLTTKLLNPYRAEPARAILNDTAAGVGAGAANEVADEYLPEDGVLGTGGRLVATLAGGVGGAALAEGVRGGAAGIGRTLRDATVGPIDPASPNRMAPSGRMEPGRVNRRDMDDAARTMQAGVRDPKREAGILKEATDDFGQMGAIGDAMPLTGELSPRQDPRLLAMSRGERLAQAPRAMERDTARQSLAGQKVEETVPEGATGRGFTDFAETTDRNRVQAAQRDVDAARTRAEANRTLADQEGGTLLPMRGGEADASIRLDDEIVGRGLAPASERSSRMYQAVDPNKSSNIPAGRLVALADRIRGRVGDLADESEVIPASLLRRIDDNVAGTPATTRDSSVLGPDSRPMSIDVPGTPSQTSVGDLVQAIPQLSKLEQRARQAEKWELADNVRALRQEMDRTIRNAPDGPGKQMYLEARRNYDTTIAAPYGRGEAKTFRRDWQQDTQGRSKTRPSDTAGRFLRPQDPERATELAGIVRSAQNPAAAGQAVRDHVVSRMATGVLDANGRVNPAAAAKFVDQWRPTLQADHPDLLQELETVARTAQTRTADQTRIVADLRAANGRLTQTQRDKGALGVALGRDPEKAAAGILEGSDPERQMAEVLKEVGGNSQAKDGLKASIRDYIKAKTTSPRELPDGERAMNAGQFEKNMRKVDKVLGQLYSPQEMQSMQQARQLLQVDARRGQAPTQGSDTAYNAMLTIKRSNQTAMMRTVEAGLKLKYGALKGGGIMRSLKLAGEALTNSDEPVKAVLAEAAFNPQLAHHLLTRPVEELGTPKWNKELARILAINDVVRGPRDSTETPEPTPPTPTRQGFAGTETGIPQRPTEPLREGRAPAEAPIRDYEREEAEARRRARQQ